MLSLPSCLSLVLSFSSNNTRPGKPDAGWKNVTLVSPHHNPVTRSKPHRHLHELGNHAACLQVINSVSRTGIGLLCSRPQTLERSPSAVQATRRDVPPIHSRCIENPSHSDHHFPFPWECASRAVHAPFGPTIPHVLRRCDVSRDLEGRDLAKQPTRGF